MATTAALSPSTATTATYWCLKWAMPYARHYEDDLFKSSQLCFEVGIINTTSILQMRELRIWLFQSQIVSK